MQNSGTTSRWFSLNGVFDTGGRPTLERCATLDLGYSIASRASVHEHGHPFSARDRHRHVSCVWATASHQQPNRTQYLRSEYICLETSAIFDASRGGRSFLSFPVFLV